MKKFISIALAVIIALSCSAMAFAETTTAINTATCPYCGTIFPIRTTEEIDAYNSHIKTCDSKPTTTTTTTSTSELKCPYCGRVFNNESEYNKHITLCYSQMGLNDTDSYADADKYVKLDANSILDKLVTVFETNATWWDSIEDVIIRLIDLIENIGTAASGEADVAGAIDDLEAKVADLPIIGDVLEYVHNLITTLKQKVKDLYAGNKETTIEATETTAAEETVDTGSSSIGIIAFAAVSVAAAAAYVCTKKKA